MMFDTSALFSIVNVRNICSGLIGWLILDVGVNVANLLFDFLHLLLVLLKGVDHETP